MNTSLKQRNHTADGQGFELNVLNSNPIKKNGIKNEIKDDQKMKTKDDD